MIQERRGVIFFAYYSLVCFAFGFFLSHLLRNINSVIAPQLLLKFDLDSNQLGLLTSVYLIGFALSQFPLGYALDKYGPHASQVVLLTLASLGCFLFAKSESFIILLIARGMIGIGVGGCLMAGFKQLSLSFREAVLPKVYSIYMLFGGFGAIAAGRPLGYVLEYLSWQEIFIYLGLSFVILIIVLLTTPKYHQKPKKVLLRTDIKAFLTIVKNIEFMAIAPIFCVSVGTATSLAGIWLAEYSRNAKNFTNLEVEYIISVLYFAQLLGSLIPAFLSRYTQKYMNLSHLTVLLILPSPFLLMIIIFNDNFAINTFLWLLYGTLTATSFLAYVHLTTIFPRTISGKVNTTLNFLFFVIAFLMQWSFGYILEKLKLSFSSLGDEKLAYDITISINIFVILLTISWYYILMLRKAGKIKTNKNEVHFIK